MIKKWKNFNEELKSDRVEKIRGVYNDLISMESPDRPGIVGWRSHKNQQSRFKVLLKYVKSGEQILDYGCGVGDLSKFVKDSGIKYIGIDINENMIKLASEKYPDSEFHSMDSAFDFEKYNYDWFIASGVFSNYMNEDEMISVIKPAFEKSSKGLGVNFLLSKDVHRDGCPENEEYLRGYNPEKLRDRFKKEITNNVELIQGYVSDDFTLILRK
jgi:cyclopropane fatty-acyl-phospholipid synthase-like methyltransferase